MDLVLTGCTQGNDATAAREKATLCGLEITPACDYAQGKMGLSRIIAGFIVPWDLEKSIKSAAFLKRIGPFYFDDKRLKAGAYLKCLNSRYVVGVELNLVKKLGATQESARNFWRMCSLGVHTKRRGKVS